MKSYDFFCQMIEDRQNGKPRGIVSICSAHELVLRAAMDEAMSADMPVLIETTANQVNQFGGYTGMRPSEFIAAVRDIAAECGFPQERILFGGDHLGPLVWCDRSADEAMDLAEELIRDFTAAGFGKIHIDTSMHLGGDDPSKPLSDKIIAQRGARLCAAAEQSWKQGDEHDSAPPVYVIGSEVPTPGGHQPQESGLQVTAPEDFVTALEAFRTAFLEAGLESAWTRVIAFVVQPGVEFDGRGIYSYDRAAAAKLTGSLAEYPQLVFEGHSTDYQAPRALQELVEDGVAILKVGPALTFFCREALFALEKIECELIAEPKERSGFAKALESAMLANDHHWRGHYSGDDVQLRLARQYSFFDRARYYLGEQQVTLAMEHLLNNLSNVEIPLSLISQYLPLEYAAVRDGVLHDDPRQLVIAHIRNCLAGYSSATVGVC